MKAQGSIAAALALFLGAPAHSVEFDCIQLPADPQSRPSDCDANPDPSGWCTCLSTGLSAIKGGQPATIEQGLILVKDEPTVGKYTLNVWDGSLDLSGAATGDVIGSFMIDLEVGQPQPFLLRFDMVITDVADAVISFDVLLVETNDVTKAVLNYDPLDSAHSSGLLYRGSAESFGGANGFEMIFHSIDVADLPEGALSAAIETGDLDKPNFNVPALIQFPTNGSFTLPQRATLEMETVIVQLGFSGIDRTFPAEIALDSVLPPKETFRRADADGSKTVDLSDAINVLSFLFLGAAAPACPDAADADDSGALDLTDAIAALNWLFLGGTPPPEPGPTTCGEDTKAVPDALGPCSYDC